jgi:hypothetical protein
MIPNDSYLLFGKPVHLNSFRYIVLLLKTALHFRLEFAVNLLIIGYYEVYCLYLNPPCRGIVLDISHRIGYAIYYIGVFLRRELWR